MDFKFEANIYRELVDIAKQGLLIQRSKPVYWSWAAGTALAEAEVEYEDKVSPSIYVAFKLKKLDASVIIWTTTPWTLPANTGIALNGEEEYVQTSDGFIVAKKLYESLKESEVISGDIIENVNPKTLENTFATNPLNGRNSKIVLGDHVAMDAGTGAVHTAPGHGEDDYKVGLKYDLEVVMPVAGNGTYDNTVVREKLLPNPEEFVGMNVFKANEPILELLGDALLKRTDIKHSYPHCWRTHKPVIFRATKQWFIAIDEVYGKNKKTLRNNALEAIKDVKFYPVSGENRLNSMIENRPDWCISRQRDWGVPIAFFRNKLTDEIIYDEKVLNYIAMIFEQKGADAWYDLSIEELLYPGSGLNPNDLEKTMDILDVWFDSGSTQGAVLRSRNYDAGSFPAHMYLEGSDQHRGWFQSSLLTSLASNETAPYKAILTHGFTVDAKGEKMSKSKGNVVAPDKVLKQYGSEILRLWVAMSDYQSDLKISDGILKQMSEQYRKIRNTFRFLLANTNDLETILDINSLESIDKWIVSKAKKVFDKVEQNFKEYDFSKGLSTISHFLTNELSGVYLSFIKDRMYCDAKTSNTRISAQSAIAIIAKSLLPLIAPVLTYTVDEILEHSPTCIKGEANDVFDLVYTSIPEVKSDIDEELMFSIRDSFFEIIDDLKKEKTIKDTLELGIQTTNKTLLTLNQNDASDWFIVSQVGNNLNGNEISNFQVNNETFKIIKLENEKCPRCWKMNVESGDVECKRCKEVIGRVQ
jgi:isoleucyl-tRNA synthetase